MALVVKKEPICQCRRCKRCRFDPWAWKIPWRRAWQPTPVFLSGEPHGQRRLGGGAYGSRGHKESDTTEALSQTQLSTHTHTQTFLYVRLPMKEEGKVERILLYISSITAFITRLQLLIAQLTHYHIRHRRAGIMSSCPFSLAEH